MLRWSTASIDHHTAAASFCLLRGARFGEHQRYRSFNAILVMPGQHEAPRVSGKKFSLFLTNWPVAVALVLLGMLN